ncbi:MAG: hypothetical protein ACRD0G_00425 [Acidimicrobiales bacterium]
MTDDLGFPGYPSDNTTLTAVLGDYATAGFAAEFEVTSESAVTCVTCGQASAPSEFTMHATRRLEGASDPDDMLSVTAVSCPRCGARGTLVLGFGPNASETEAMVGKALRDQNRERTIPATPETDQTKGH